MPHRRELQRRTSTCFPIRFPARFACCLALVMLAVSPVAAEVVRIEIAERRPFAEGHAFDPTGPYERLVGRMYLEVDPDDPANRAIVDLTRAPRNERGKVEFWTDFCLLKPADAARGNRSIIYDVNNRGNKLILGAFNNKGGNDPITLADAGNGFLMRHGYSVLWCGWNGDVAPGGGRMMIGLPVARDVGGTITGRIHAEIRVDQRTFSQPFAWGNTDPYPAISLDPREAGATLTMRPDRDQPAVEIAADQWAFARWEDERAVPDAKHLYLKEGFRPGWLYDLVYTGRDPRVTGLGLAAVRDVVSFFKHADGTQAEAANPLAGHVDRAYAFGISQSGRFIHHFLYEGFNGDERGRTVFDGAIAHVPGAGRGLFNARFAQTTRHGSPHEDRLYPADTFPFTTTPSRDPETGREGEILAQPRAGNHVPKLFFTQTSTEYWCRAASLLHTDVDGTADVPLDPSVRIYFIAGGQHGVSGSPARGLNQNQVNILDYRPALRALLLALDRWVAASEPPPDSRYPRISDGTLVDALEWRKEFPAIPAAGLPRAPYAPFRLDFGPRWEQERIADVVPPHVGKPYRTLVPAVDADGNERAGIRLPAIAAPLATYSGWNLRSADAGAEGQLARLAGSYFPFPRTRAERESSGDSRASVEERYPTRDAYIARVTREALELARDRLLLDEDVVEILRQAERQNPWDSAGAASSGNGAK